jgi:hypothetical protein
LFSGDQRFRNDLMALAAKLINLLLQFGVLFSQAVACAVAPISLLIVSPKPPGPRRGGRIDV